jgi:hypothetical protein
MTNGLGTVHLFYYRYYYNSGAVEIVVNEGLTNQLGTAWTYQARLILETLQYQWRKDGTIIPGATAPTLLIPYPLEHHSGQYTVTVGDGYGSIVSEPATLTVVAPTPPTLHLARLADGSLHLFWDAPNFILETATDLAGPWYHAGFGINSHIFPPGQENQFFRLRENYSPPGD